MYICVFTLYISRTHAQTPPELQAAVFCKGDHWKLYTVQGFAVSVDVNLTKSPIRSTFLLTNPKGSRITSIGIPGALAAAHLILEPLGDRGIWTFIHSDLSRGVFLGQLEPLTFHNREFLGHVKLGIRNQGTEARHMGQAGCWGRARKDWAMQLAWKQCLQLTNLSQLALKKESWQWLPYCFEFPSYASKWGVDSQCQSHGDIQVLLPNGMSS